MTKREMEPEIVTNLASGSTYGDYLCLDQILTAQKPRSTVGRHDEMLFIIQHQTSELWMRLMVHELDEAIANVKNDQLSPCFKILARVGQIQRMLFEQWSVLETMTPNEYLTFRPALGPASGFQSYQYRAIEFALGNKDPKTLAPHKGNPAVHADLQARLERPSLYDEFLRWLARHGHAIPKSHLERDFTLPYEPSDEIVAVFKRIYEDTTKYWSEYDMCEKLVDVEERFQLWRFRHVTTVKRVIGFKRGTGGSSGVPFLEKALLNVFFPELWDVRTRLESPAAATEGFAK